MNMQLCKILVASSLGLAALAGCSTPATTPTPSANAGSDSGAESAAALSEERTMDDHAFIANQEDASAAAYELRQIAAAVTTSITLPADIRAAVNARLAAREQLINARLTKLDVARAKIRASLKNLMATDNGNGTSTKTIKIEMEATAKNKGARRAEFAKTVKTDTKDLLSWHIEFNRTNPGGLSRVSTRDKSLQADGSYRVVFHTVMTLPNGRMRTTDWNKVIGADGAVSGTGTIVWKDKAGTITKATNVTLGGDEDKPTATAKETGAMAKMTVDGKTEIKTDSGQTKSIEADAELADDEAAVEASANAAAG